MYNEEQKWAFINQYSRNASTRRYIASMFNVFTDKEISSNTDMCTWSNDDIVSCLQNTKGSIRGKSMHLKMNYVVAYIQWCIDNDVSGVNAEALHISTPDVDIMANCSVTGPMQLQIFLNSLFSKEVEGIASSDIVYRCVCWMAFSGIQSEEEVLSLTSDNIDIDTMTITTNGRKYPIYRDALYAIKSCSEQTQFMYNHPSYGSVIRDRVPGREIVRGIRSLPKVNTLRVELARTNKNAVSDGKTAKKLSYFRIWLSGVFYRMYELELAGLQCEFTDIAYKIADINNHVNDDESKYRKYIRSVSNDLKKDYEKWKLTLIK